MKRIQNPNIKLISHQITQERIGEQKWKGLEVVTLKFQTPVFDHLRSEEKTVESYEKSQQYYYFMFLENCGMNT